MRDIFMTSEDEKADSRVLVVPDQKTLALINTYIASTTKAVNHVAASCEHSIHRIDRRLERVSINMSLLEDKVDSAVASHESAETVKRSAAEVPADESHPHADEPHSSTASASDGMEEINTGPPVPGAPHSREDMVGKTRSKAEPRSGRSGSSQHGQGSSR